MGFFYFMLVSRGLKPIKLEKKYFFPPISNKFAIQINLPMQLCLIFHKTIIKLKALSQGLRSFSAIKKTVTGVEGGRR